MSIEIIIKNLPDKPGIYKMLDRKNSVIYVGKATNLKKRVSSYFLKSQNSIKTLKLVENIKNIETIITHNEEEALILENNLIKKFKPKYNILLRDDKSYPYIFIDTKHKYPLVKFYRGIKSKKNGIYFGPFTEVYKVRYMLNLIQKIFKLRSCENSFFKNRKKPCLQYQINRCDAPCTDFISEKKYKEVLDNAILFLQGKNEKIIDNFTNEMNFSSQTLEYEKAKEYRDKISMIRSIAKPKTMIEDHADLDIISSANNSDYVFVDIFVVRNGINLGNIPFHFELKGYGTKEIVLDSFIKQYYLKHEPPSRIVLPFKIENEKILEIILTAKYKKKIKLIISKRKPFSDWLKLCNVNTDNRMKSHSVVNKKYNYLSSFSKLFKLIKKIENIICFDVSHLSGTNATGSAVWFNNKGPNKKLYRRYNLDHINKSDDYAALKYMLKRRLKRLMNEDNLPDIILIDGGKGQITQANNVLAEFSLNKIIVLSVVKGHKRKTDNDRILDSEYNDITKNLSNENIKILQTIRDEAHRFAIMGQRKKSEKKYYKSILDGIPGIGKMKKIEILKFFGGIQGVLKASSSDISRVSGIGDKLAEDIYTYLQKNDF